MSKFQAIVTKFNPQAKGSDRFQTLMDTTGKTLRDLKAIVNDTYPRGGHSPIEFDYVIEYRNLDLGEITERFTSHFNGARELERFRMGLPEPCVHIPLNGSLTTYMMPIGSMLVLVSPRRMSDIDIRACFTQAQRRFHDIATMRKSERLRLLPEEQFAYAYGMGHYILWHLVTQQSFTEMAVTHVTHVP